MVKSIYLVTRLYNTEDKIRACELESKLQSLLPDSDIFMPYRDIDEDKIADNWKKTIFHKDIGKLDKADLLIGFWDGTEFDEGIGFEIGYALAKGKKVIVLNSDFIEYFFTESKNRFFMPDPLFEVLDINFVRNQFKMRKKYTFYEDLISAQKEHFTDSLKACSELIHEQTPLRRRSQEEERYFIECGPSISLRREANRLKKSNHYLSNRFEAKNTFRESSNDLSALLSSSCAYIIATWPELSPGSSVISGICFALGIPFYILNDRAVGMMGMIEEEMPVNLMIDCAAEGYVTWDDMQ